MSPELSGVLVLIHQVAERLIHRPDEKLLGARYNELHQGLEMLIEGSWEPVDQECIVRLSRELVAARFPLHERFYLKEARIEDVRGHVRRCRAHMLSAAKGNHGSLLLEQLEEWSEPLYATTGAHLRRYLPASEMYFETRLGRPRWGVMEGGLA